jgi:hypothetical protein
MNPTLKPYREKLRACQWFCALRETLQEDLIVSCRARRREPWKAGALVASRRTQ